MFNLFFLHKFGFCFKWHYFMFYNLKKLNNFCHFFLLSVSSISFRRVRLFSLNRYQSNTIISFRHASKFCLLRIDVHALVQIHLHIIYTMTLISHLVHCPQWLRHWMQHYVIHSWRHCSYLHCCRVAIFYVSDTNRSK